MKKLKQALSLALALVLSLSLAVPAFAEEDPLDWDLRECFDISNACVECTNDDFEDVYTYVYPVGTTITPTDSCFFFAEYEDDTKNQDEYETLYESGKPFVLSDQELHYLYYLGEAENGEQAVGGLFLVRGSDSGAKPAQPEQPAAPEQPSKPEQPAVTVPEGSVAYTVQKGDTMGFIATNFYGSNANRNALYNANLEAFKKTGGKLVPGMVLAIPATLNKVNRIPAPSAGEGEKLYTVKAGDTLGKIAAAEYGKVNEYKAIFERNSDRLKNANTIYEGQVIVLPAKK